MIFSTTTADPGTVYAVDLPETLRDASVRAQCPGYRFWAYPGRVARGARRPALAQDLDQVSLSTIAIAADGTLTARAADGTMQAVALPKGKDGKDGADGKAGADGERGPQGAVGTPKRVEAYVTPGCDAAATVTLTFPVPFAAPPEIIPKRTIGALSTVEGQVVSVTAKAVTLRVYRQLLSTGLLSAAPAGTACSLTAIGD